MKEGQEHLDHLTLAGKYCRQAHNHWLRAMRESTPDTDKAEAMRAGDAAWDFAEQHLREYGVGLDDVTDAERKMLLTDECFNASNLIDESPEPELDFAPLERSYKAWILVRFVNVLALAGLLGGFAYVSGYSDGRDAGAYPTGAQMLEQLQQLNDELRNDK